MSAVWWNAVCLALVVPIRLDRFLAVDAAGEGFVERSPSSIDEDEVAEDEPVEEVVSWFVSSREPARPSGPSWARSSAVRSAAELPLELLWLSLKATSSAVSSKTTLQHLIFWVMTRGDVRLSFCSMPAGRSTRKVNRSERDIIPITWSSLSTTIIRWTCYK